MEPALRDRFVAAIREEAERLSRQLEDSLQRGGDALQSLGYDVFRFVD